MCGSARQDAIDEVAALLPSHDGLTMTAVLNHMLWISFHRFSDKLFLALLFLLPLLRLSLSDSLHSAASNIFFLLASFSWFRILLTSLHGSSLHDLHHPTLPHRGFHGDHRFHDLRNGTPTPRGASRQERSDFEGNGSRNQWILDRFRTE